MSDLVDTDYVPSEDEPFMNDRQKAYFRRKLVTWKNDILREARETLEILQQENANHPDLADRASSETDRAIELRARDRQRKLIAKIDAALQRLEDGTYGRSATSGARRCIGTTSDAAEWWKAGGLGPPFSFGALRRRGASRRHSATAAGSGGRSAPARAHARSSRRRGRRRRRR